MNKQVKTVVIDYGAGNLRSVEKALNFINAEFSISSDPSVVSSSYLSFALIFISQSYRCYYSSIICYLQWHNSQSLLLFICFAQVLQ